MKTQYTIVRYLDHKTRKDISSHDTAIQADNAWRNTGSNQNERIVYQILRDDGTVCYEENLLLAGAGVIK